MPGLTLHTIQGSDLDNIRSVLGDTGKSIRIISKVISDCQVVVVGRLKKISGGIWSCSQTRTHYTTRPNTT